MKTDVKIRELKSVVIIGIVTLTFACANSVNEKVDTDKNLELNKIEVKSDVASPCELFTLKQIKRIFDTGNFPVNISNATHPYPSCIIKWNDGKVSNSVSYGAQNTKINMPSEVIIVMTALIHGTNFDQIVKVYPDAKAVNNIGEHAVWSEKRSQMTFYSQKHLFHIRVKVSNDQDHNFQKAKEVAKIVIAQL